MSINNGYRNGNGSGNGNGNGRGNGNAMIISIIVLAIVSLGVLYYAGVFGKPASSELKTLDQAPNDAKIEQPVKLGSLEHSKNYQSAA